MQHPTGRGTTSIPTKIIVIIIQNEIGKDVTSLVICYRALLLYDLCRSNKFSLCHCYSLLFSQWIGFCFCVIIIIFVTWLWTPSIIKRPSVFDPRGRPQSRPVVITIFTQSVRPKTWKSSINHCGLAEWIIDNSCLVIILFYKFLFWM